MPEVTGRCTNGGVGEWAFLILWLEIILLTMKTAAIAKHTLKMTHFEARMSVHLSRNHLNFKNYSSNIQSRTFPQNFLWRSHPNGSCTAIDDVGGRTG
ncbi:MAG: hypothetical protein P8Y74_04935 [Desulfobacterales bacterium]